MNFETKPSMVRGTRRVTLGATLAIAAAGALIAPPAFAAGETLTVSGTPQSGTAFSVTAGALSAGTNYKVILSTSGVDTSDQAEGGTCKAGAVASGATWTCTIEEASPGTYVAKLVTVSAPTVALASQSVTVAATTATTIAPTATENAGNADTVTVTKQDGVVWKVDDVVVDFAGAPTKAVAVTDGAAVVTAEAAPGYQLPAGATTKWTYRFSTTNTALSSATPPTEGSATAPKYTDVPSTNQDTVTVTKTTGIDWYVNGTKVTFAGDATTATVYSTVGDKTTVSARAADGYVFSGSLAEYWYTPKFTDLKADPPTTRLQGANRMDTAVAISKKYWDTASTVYVANGLRYADALTAGPAAAKDDGPLLLVNQNSVPSNVLDEIKRLKPARIHIVGGTSVVSADVEKALGDVAPVTRLSGATRYATAAAVASKWADNAGGTVYLALGENFPDALSGGSGAAKEGGALLLSQKSSLTQSTVDALKRIKPTNVVLVGGTDVLSAAVALEVKDAINVTPVRYAGADRYATSAAVAAGAKTAEATDKTLFLATGLNFPDALAGVPAANKVGAPLFLSQPTCLPKSVKTVVDSMTALDSQVRLGSEGVLGKFQLTTTCAS